MTIGFVDLVSTAWLHDRGLIRELNPIMKVMLDQGAWLFVLVKSLTLVVAWFALAHYAKKDPAFVRMASIGGSAAYLGIWCIWFFSSR